MVLHRSEEQNSAFRLHCADARELSTTFGALNLPCKPFITTTITSPPYGALKNYGGINQLGWQQRHDEYLADCGKVLEQVHAATVEQGNLWLIVDTITTRRPGGFQLQMLPFQLAEIAEDVGWVLRDVIIWHKDRTVPWAAQGRLRNAFEYVLFFVKSSTFKYYPKRLAEPIRSSQWWIRFPERYSPEGVTPSNVWTIPIPKQGSWGQDSTRHACPLPPDLVDRLVHLSSDPGDVVFDPFAGTGTVLSRAAALGRLPLGLETNEDLVSGFEVPKVAEPSSQPRSTDPTAATILKLRALKFARVVHERATGDERFTAHPVRIAIVDAVIRPRSDRKVTGSVTFVLDGRPSRARREHLLEALQEAAGRKPASKFGVDLAIQVAAIHDVDPTSRRRMWVYPNGRFWSHAGSTMIPRYLEGNSPTKRTTILSNLKVNEDLYASELRD